MSKAALSMQSKRCFHCKDIAEPEHQIKQVLPCRRAWQTTESSDLFDSRLFDKLIIWEQGQLFEPETLAFSQELVTSGLA
jgi:hypothetical protein